MNDKEKKEAEGFLKRYRDNLDRLFSNPQPAEAKAMLVFCINCGEIIGIGGGRFNV